MPCRRSSEFRSMRMGWPDENATLWTPTATDFASPRGGPDSEGYLSRAVGRAAVTAPLATVTANEYERTMGREVVLNFDDLSTSGQTYSGDERALGCTTHSAGARFDPVSTRGQIRAIPQKSSQPPARRLRHARRRDRSRTPRPRRRPPPGPRQAGDAT